MLMLRIACVSLFLLPALAACGFAGGEESETGAVVASETPAAENLASPDSRGAGACQLDGAGNETGYCQATDACSCCFRTLHTSGCVAGRPGTQAGVCGHSAYDTNPCSIGTNNCCSAE
jgi:hypothetical protein